MSLKIDPFFFFPSLLGNEGKVITLARGDEGVASVIDEDQTTKRDLMITVKSDSIENVIVAIGSGV